MQTCLQQLVKALLVMQVLARDGHRRVITEDVQLLARDVALLEQREHLTCRFVSLEHNQVTLTGDADHRAWHPWRITPNDGAVG